MDRLVLLAEYVRDCHDCRHDRPLRGIDRL